MDQLPAILCDCDKCNVEGDRRGSGRNNTEQRVDVLERQLRSLRGEMRAITEWQYVMCSAMYKRLWWVLLGWNFNSLGRWYWKSLYKG